jgi:hypothetical protein
MGGRASRVEPLLRDPLIASIVIASFRGRLTSEPAALLAQWLAGDETARGPLEDLAHQLEILDGRGAWEVEPREWLEVTGHEHVWLPYAYGGPPAIGALFRCPCGRFSNGYHAGTYPDGRRIVDVNNDGFGIMLGDGVQLEMRELRFLRAMARHCSATRMPGAAACDCLDTLLESMGVGVYDSNDGPTYGIFEDR